jgi:DNA polymerase-1
LKVFREGGDPHASVAAELHGIPVSSVGEAQRGDAKAVNFGIIYGETYKGLAENDSQNRGERWWKRFLAEYVKAYPEISTFRDKIKAEMLRFKYVESPFGARRHFPEYPTGKWSLDESMIRRGVNHPFQNSASTINCRAARQIQQAFDEYNWKSMVISLVHDSLMFDLHPSEIEPATDLIFRVMEQHGLDWITIPTPIDYALGERWGMAETI